MDPTVWISAGLRAWVIAALIAASSVPATAIQSAQPPAGSAKIFPTVGAGLFAAGSRAVRVFSDADGLPHNTVHTIALDREGAMWIGTQDGAARYNGRTWTVVNMPNRLNSNFVRTIRATQDGSVYFGTQSGGLARLRDGEWAMYGEGPGTLPSARVNALIETTGKNGGSALWIATYGGGLARIEGNRFTVWTKREGLPSLRVWGLAGIPDRHGNPVVWVGTESGLARLASGAGRFEIEHAFDGISVNQILSVPGPGGPTLWVGTYGKGIARSTPTGWQFLTTSQGMPSDYLTSLQASRDEAGNPVVFAGTDGGGLARITQSGIDVLSNSAGLPSQAIYSLFETRPESGGQALWIGTRNGGLVRLREGAWRTFHPPVDSPTMAVNAITAISSPTGSPILAFGTDGGGLATLSGTTWDVLSTRNRRLPVDTVLSLLASSDSSGRPVLWVGTRNGGLARVRGSSTEVFSRATGHLPSDIVLDLVESTDNSGRRILWAATRGGLVRFDGTQWSTIDTRSGLPSNSVYGVVTTRAADGQDVIWAATLGGLARLAGGHWQHFGTESGLLSVAVQALCPATLPDGRPALWVGTEGGGLSCLELDTDPPRVTTLTDETEPRLPNNTVSKIMVDRDRRLWVTTNRGVARLTPRPGGGARSFDVMTYTVADGLPSSQCTHAAGMVDESGRIWVGTVNGAAAFDPRGEVLDHAAKPLRLAASIRDGTVVLPGSSLNHNQNHVLFDAALMSLYREQDTRYRTQLVGVEHEPSRWTEIPRREYSALPSGEFVFQVWGRDWAGNVTGPVELPFTIAMAWWQTDWAWLSYLLAAIGLVGFVVVVRERASRRRERVLQALVDARTTSLQDANERLAHMSYHDSLTGLANRRHFDEQLEIEWKRGIRAGSPLAMLMLDIDRFKDFNDTRGHILGDACLQKVADVLERALPRASDMAARYGGDEFAVILPATDLSGAVTVAENLRQLVAAGTRAAGEPSGICHATISVGVAAVVPTLDVAPADLIRVADQALYLAKASGRDSVRTADWPIETGPASRS